MAIYNINGLEVSLINILMIWLCFSKVICSKTEKKLYCNKHVMDHTCMTSTCRGKGGLEICHVFADSFVFTQHLFLIFPDRGVK